MEAASMRNSDYQKPRYVDISYGWQERREAVDLARRDGRRRRVLLLGIVALPVVVYLFWRLT